MWQKLYNLILKYIQDYINKLIPNLKGKLINPIDNFTPTQIPIKNNVFYVSNNRSKLVNVARLPSVIICTVFSF